MRAWRITQQRHAETAFSGEGARLYGGRWNSPGTPLVYVASSQSLAVLEVLVHLDAAALLRRYVLIPADFDDALVSDLDLATLPTDWRADPAPQSVQSMGDRWAASGASMALRVPSVLVPGESNYLLNPRHADFAQVAVGEPTGFVFDPRLARQ